MVLLEKPVAKIIKLHFFFSEMVYRMNNCDVFLLIGTFSFLVFREFSLNAKTSVSENKSDLLLNKLN